MSRVRRTALYAVGAALSFKGLLLTANDDWDDVIYPLKKRLLPTPGGMGAGGGGATGTAAPRRPRVVVLGTGWGALSFIQKLDTDAVDLTVVSPRSFFFYTPLLAGTASGTVSHTSIMEPIRWFLERRGHPGASFLQAECTAIDPAAKRVTLQAPQQPPRTLEYDHLVCAVGAVPATFNIPGVREHARFMKEVEDGVAVQRAILRNLEAASALLAAAAPAGAPPPPAVEAEVARLLSWVVIGGGPTGVELVGELLDFQRAEVARYFPALAPRVTITLVEAAGRLLGAFDAPLAATAARTLIALGARVECNAAVTRVAPDAVEFKRTAGGGGGGGGGVIQHGGVCVWAGGVARRPVVEAFARSLDPAGAAQTSRHGLLVDAFFRVRGAPAGSVFALGDCAVSGCAPTAQAAVQQGRFLGRAFRDALPALEAANPAAAAGAAGARLSPFAFRPRGALAYTGGGTGVAELASLRAALWDAHPEKGGVKSGAATHVEGASAFAIWRSLYFSSILSTSNQAAVAFDWFRTFWFGRAISAVGAAERDAAARA